MIYMIYVCVFECVCMCVQSIRFYHIGLKVCVKSFNYNKAYILSSKISVFV